jgi:hypothetical protein
VRKWRSIVMGSAVLVAAASAGVGSAPGAGAEPGCKQNVTVSDLGDDGGENQIRSQLVDLCDGGTVRVTPGTLVLQQGALTLTHDVVIDGLGPAANPTVIDAGHHSRVFDIDHAHVVISDLSVTGGSGDNGGAIRNTSGDVVLDNVTATGNSATNAGGAIASFGTAVAPASFTLNHSTIAGNNAFFGGGGIVNIARGGDALMTLNDTAVSDNVAVGSAPGFGPFGGGILNSTSLPPQGGSPSLVVNGSSSITRNRAYLGGGVFSNGDGTAAHVTLNDTASVTDNTSVTNGAGLFNFGQHGAVSTLTLNDDVIVSNNHGARAGGVFNEGTFEMNDRATIDGNAATQDGGGVLNLSQTAPATIVLRHDSSIRNNTAGGLSAGGGIANAPSGFPTSVSILDQAVVVDNHPKNCSGTLAC